MTYGVLPTGFNRKSLSAIKAELEEAMIAVFGAEVIQTPQSPLGMLNGLMADAIAEEWETSEDVYQSFDIDQAVGPRLDTLAKMRYMKRMVGELDEAFHIRLDNEGQADLKMVTNIQRLLKIDGVTWANAHENSTSSVNTLGMPPHSVAYAVTGGADVDVGWMIYQMAISGIELYGNYRTDIVADGYCQQAIFIRPAIVPIKVEIDVHHVPDPCNCAPPSASTIVDFVINYFAGSCGYRNGDTVTREQLFTIASRIPGIAIDDVRIARVENSIEATELPMTLFERPVIVSPYVTASYAEEEIP